MKSGMMMAVQNHSSVLIPDEHFTESARISQQHSSHLDSPTQPNERGSQERAN
jgi:hypothetical protein